MKKLLISSIVATALVLSFANVNVFAQSSKAAIGNSSLAIISDSSAIATTSTETPWKTIMSANIRTANDKGFAFDVALQTGIFTDTSVSSRKGAKATASASGRVLVRVQVTPEGGDPGYAQPSADIVKWAGPEDQPVINADSGVTYDYRNQLLEASFQGLCIDYSGDVPVLLEDCEFETVRFMLDTLQAHSFNFYYGLTDSGVYNIQVQTMLITDATGQDDEDAKGVASARALVGLGSMFVENVRLVKGSGWDAPDIDLR